MTLARKGSRTLLTPTGAFRWVVRGRPNSARAMGWSPLEFVVEQGRPAGAPLHVRLLPWVHPRSWVHPLAPTTGAVTPRLVRMAVDTALGRGWDAARPGRPFRLDLDERDLESFQSIGPYLRADWG